ncbi:DUF5319 domain-containing protein [Corynebacterium kroppenstedtii]|uniref:DUF5319 domain-containing protein n=1 Tax=Corynebacterium pseudokroppenstedtii TaxID=2804917 RepID=UPI001951F26E|nr:DUF5319 domain-containing protein [Corynebacterium pseudokroppenstedtii]MDK7148388.1 DUF5319 domain-containing protein [Corynebacterium pseudokroppenstedtii]MDU7503475.1 DUF5319 domain-containing protein [Corynebacterium kroppenstedtii]QRP15418.1 DUF5319 domain-containing protein [Corynebacterium kroppenstedtii]
MPPDPFAGDPNDPASFLDPDEPMEPLTDEEKGEVIIELHHVREMQRVLTPLGIRGVEMLCDDCEELHYYDWGILINNLLALYNHEQPPIHEPSAKPNPDEYAPWDYCLGFLDGLNHGIAGYR